MGKIQVTIAFKGTFPDTASETTFQRTLLERANLLVPNLANLVSGGRVHDVTVTGGPVEPD